MKKPLFCIAVASVAIVAGCSRFSNRGEIEMPLIESANTTALSFERIVLTDSSTMLDAVIHFRPDNWIRFDSASSIIAEGKEYPIISIDSLQFGELYWMPDSGVAHFRLYFPAIPSSARYIDFTENTEDGWQLWGIQLDKDYEYKTIIPDKMLHSNPDATLPEPNIVCDTATVNIHLLNYRPEMGSKLSYVVNTLTGQVGDLPKLDIDEKGNTTLKRKVVGYENMLLIGFDNFPVVGSVLMSPGETVDYYYDCRFSGYRNMNERNEAKDIPEISYIGSNGNLTRIERDAASAPYCGFQLYSGEFGSYKMDGDEYSDYVVSMYKANLDSINASEATPAVKEMKTLNLQANVIQAITMAQMILRRNYYHVHQNWGEKVPADTINVEISPENARMIAGLIDLNNPKLLYSHDSTTPDDLIYTDVWNNAGIETKMLDDLRTYNEAYDLAESGKLDSERIEALRASYPAFADAVAERQKETEALMSSKAVELIEPTPDVADDKVFDEIIKPYKGKVVVVDLWNTWCGPCRHAIAANEPLKSGKLASDDIVWIYIADESSPIKKYLEMIPDIKGHHFRVNPTQIAKIRKRFDVDGIPYYILVDRQGKAAGRPDLRDHNLYVKTILDML